MKEKDKKNEIESIFERFTYDKNLTNKYPTDSSYYSLNSQFIKLKKVTREDLVQKYEIIISNSNHRELIFHGVYCILTPKEYFLVKYLLENGIFHNKNFTELGLRNIKKCVFKVRKAVKLVRKSKKLKGKIFVIDGIEKSDLKKIFNRVKKESKNTITKSKIKERTINFTADKKSEISNYRNKIKTKIEDCMQHKNILLKDFDYKFDCFMRTKYYNYECENPVNSYQTLVTSYRCKIEPKRVSKQSVRPQRTRNASIATIVNLIKKEANID